MTAALLVVEDEAKRIEWEREILVQKLAHADAEVTELEEKYREVR